MSKKWKTAADEEDAKNERIASYRADKRYTCHFIAALSFLLMLRCFWVAQYAGAFFSLMIAGGCLLVARILKTQRINAHRLSASGRKQFAADERKYGKVKQRG
ncbi:hypothetical protein AGMMS49545_20630 [Betaproteobacteria bacterium]|nr:hypothetical protein AGMMS49545_20630 [Betaproteobacteria bacterium]GHU39764.1 hypothetical protein AGMMS50289_00050 [Betaproteobacteria bacterium]